MNKPQTLWWLISLLMIALASYLFMIFKPGFVFDFSGFVLGILAGSFTYYSGRLLQARRNKQLVSLRGIFINSVVISPLAEEILFRFGVIVVLFNSSLLGILTSIATWVIIHLAYEIVSETPFRYYRTAIGFADSVVSGIVLSVIYVYSGFNLFVPWIAHALHNLLIWISIAYPAKCVLALQSKGTVHKTAISSSWSSPLYRIRYMPKTIFKVLTPVLLVVLLFVPLAFATHNPSVSHSADKVTNGTFRNNYSDLEARI
ncbi:MAG: CPBP family intramembrane metalloprotease [Candidatus Aenigmarchaeota archaeon]|nr:CPBP family intramembrane metalloprotease [Candidatus Aenigmarchaeota archaeon]